MSMDNYFRKRKDQGLRGAQRKAPQPRKRFRRRGPGLLTSDTDLQKRLNSLMQDASPDDLFEAHGRENPEDSQVDDDEADIPFDKSVLERLPEKASGSKPDILKDKDTKASAKKKHMKESEDGKTKDLNVFQLPPGLSGGDTKPSPGEHTRSKGSVTKPISKRQGKKEEALTSSMPAFLRRKLNGPGHISRLFRRRHFKMYNKLLYDMPRREDDGTEVPNETEQNDQDNDTEDEDRHGALKMLLGAAEAMK